MNECKKWSEWRKWDLHFHTPSSYDYKDKSVTNEEIINYLNTAWISVVAITDHHIIDVPRIKELQKIGATKNITVLPWIEFLSDARSSDPIHFIGIFSENCNIDHIWWQIKHRTAIKKIEWEHKAFNEVYCDLEDTIKIIHELWGIISIHSWQKHWSIEWITNSLPQTVAQKTDIANIVDIFELWKETDQDGYRDKVFPAIWKILPMIICSDNHNIKYYVLKQNCWIKADTTFEWLLQIIHEPEERVYIWEEQPDKKLSYQYIDRVEFIDSEKWTIFDTKEIQLNPNLNAIIWSRSSGKSALLAYIGNRIVPKFIEENKVLPWAWKSWDEVKNIQCNVYWANGKENNDSPWQVTYIPQWYLVKFSEDQLILEEEIIPLLERNTTTSPVIEEYNKLLLEIKSIDYVIVGYIGIFFDLSKKIDLLKKSNLSIWDKDSIQKVIIQKDDEIKKLQSTWISKEEIALVSELATKIKTINDRIIFIKKQIEEYNDPLKTDISIELTTQWLPRFAKNGELFDTIIKIEESKKIELISEVKNLLWEFIKSISTELESLIQEDQKIRQENKLLIEKYQANKVITKLISELTDEKKKIENITLNEGLIAENILSINDCINFIWEKIEEKENIFNRIKLLFSTKININNINIWIEIDVFTEEEDRILSGLFDRRSRPPEFIDQIDTKWLINRSYIKDNIRPILTKLYDSHLIYNLKNSWDLVAEKIFTLNKEVRFYGELDWDKLGGFHPTTMSQWKQSLFALMLILWESTEKWPLLIDQPEDDLDARSIYDEIVPFLKEKKKERQIIMVSHNANLVVSADAEEIIVSNKDSTQRPNVNEFTFNYKTWSLESSKNDDWTIHDTLEKKWVREHACEILDWWIEAFEKRKNKYSI